MKPNRRSTPITEERLALDMAAVMRALAAAHRASAEALEGQIAAMPTTIVVAPELLTQRNVESVVGLPAEVYLEVLRSPGFPVPVTKLGKLRVVERVPFLAWVKSYSSPSAPNGEAAEPADAGMSSTAFAAATGMVPVPAPPRSGTRIKPTVRTAKISTGQGRR